MKKFFFLAAAFVASIGAMAQQKAEEVIKVNHDKHDFGKIKVGVPVTTFFTITNTTDKPLVIENAWAGCGCTTPEYSKEPIAPGGTSQLKVGYNAAAMGRFEKDVNIKLAGVAETKIVKITGEVVTEGTEATVAKKETTQPAVVVNNTVNVNTDKKPVTTKTKTKTAVKKASK